MSADYENVQKGALKLFQRDSSSKKKKKKRKKKEELEQKLRMIASGDLNKPDGSSPPEKVDTRTKAQIAFAKVKEERDAAEVLERASLTHKERIMKFNENLDKLSEHFDIPKVSWTK